MLAFNVTLPTPRPADAAVIAFLNRRWRLAEAPKTIPVKVDLRNRGGKQTLVYVNDPRFCGSGGCNLYALEPKGRSFRLLMHATIVQLPVRLLPTSSHGYRDIGVMVSGGGIMKPYEAKLSFNGRSYANNPSIPPAVRMKFTRGRVLISQADLVAR